MTPSVGGAEVASTRKKATSPSHRYFTRSCKEQQDKRHDSKYRNRRISSPRPIPQTTQHPVNTPTRLSPSPSEASICNEDPQGLDPTPLDGMMDQISYSPSNPLRTPFPSPALKSTLPVSSFSQNYQGSQKLHSDGGLTQQETSWHQSGSRGTCILVEAANRAQMAILIDDMGSMGIEPMEQT